MATTTITTPTAGIIGFLHSIERSEDSVLVFQLPRKTDMLSDVYISGAARSLNTMLPDGQKYIVVGCDVNILQLTGADITALVLKGLI